MEQHHTIIAEEVGARTEECFELRPADMFKHANRNDPVKPLPLFSEIAIVDQFECDAV